MKLNTPAEETEAPADGEVVKRSRKRPEPEGSRWAALILLVIVLGLGLLFYLKSFIGQVRLPAMPSAGSGTVVIE